MPIKDEIKDLSDQIGAAAVEAAQAYDALIAELKKSGAVQPDPDEVLIQSGTIFNASLKAWARLVLAPGRIAGAITGDPK